MAIVVKHSGNAAPAAVGAYGAGQGKRYAEDARLAMDRITRQKEAQRDRNFQAGQADAARRFSSQERDEDRQFSADQTDVANRERDLQREKDRQFDYEQRGLDRQAQNTLEGDRNQAETGRMFLKNDLERQNVEFGYTAQQRAKFNEISDAIARVQNDPTLKPDEIAEATRQLKLQQNGLQPVGILKPPTPMIEGRRPNEPFVTPSGVEGMYVPDGRNGYKFQKISDNIKPTWRDRLDARKMFMEQFKDADTDAVDFDAVNNAMSEMFGEQDAAEEEEGKPRFSFSDPKQARKTFDTALAEAEKAIKNAPKANGKKPVDVADNAAITVVTDADFEALPSGALFIAPDGTKRRKP